jgi:hypothetical protein
MTDRSAEPGIGGQAQWAAVVDLEEQRLNRFCWAALRRGKEFGDDNANLLVFSLGCLGTPTPASSRRRQFFSSAYTANSSSLTDDLRQSIDSIGQIRSPPSACTSLERFAMWAHWSNVALDSGTAP